MRLQNHEHVEEQVTEIAGVECVEASLISGVELAAPAVGEAFAFPRVDVRRAQSLIFPLVDQAA